MTESTERSVFTVLTHTHKHSSGIITQHNEMKRMEGNDS